MNRPAARGQRSLALAPPVCPVCAGDRWMRLTGLIYWWLSKDVPCPVCNRHPDLPAVCVTADPKDVT